MQLRVSWNMAPRERIPPGATDGSPDASRQLRRRQALVVVLLFAGYAAYYFCRANLSVATPLIVDELAGQGISRDDALLRISGIVSFGTLAYALGKLILTGIADVWGGRRAFLLGLAGAALFTVAFALGGSLPVFTLAWIGNRIVQSIGWAGLLKVCSRWFDFSSYGTIVGILSLSYLVGDAGARQSMGMLIDGGSSWRTVFYFAAAVAAVLWALAFFLLRESRVEVGHGEATENPLNVFADSAGANGSFRRSLLKLVTTGPFLLVCALSFGCTVVRETFNAWTPTYLHDSLGFTVGAAAQVSAVFPGVGAVSVLLAGWLSDRLGANGRALLLVIGMITTTISLLLLGAVKAGPLSSVIAVGLIGLTAFCLLGSYAFLGGAMALDFGGRQAGATASGIIDGIGYLGGALAGIGVATVVISFGWNGVFMALAAVCAISAVAAAFLFRAQSRAMRAKAGA